MSGVLIYHNILWAHYKGRVFSELHDLCADQGIAFFVVHFAVSERQREGLGDVDRSLHRYPHKVLTEGSFDELPFFRKVRLALRELKRCDPQIVVLPGYWDPSFWVLLFQARAQGRRVIVSCDSTELDHARSRFKESIKRVFISKCHAGFAYGTRAKRYLQKLGMPAERITVRCQAAANDEIRRAYESAIPERATLTRKYGLGSRNFCFVGRLSAEKNVASLITAFARLRREHPRGSEWGLLVIGDGPERAALRDLCQAERVENVFLAGGVGWREVPRLLAACDVFVLPSLSEPWGLVVNEAMVCGLPVIASDRCGCVEDLVRHGETGLTYDASSSGELANCMKYFMDSPARIGDFGASATRLISLFSPSAAASQMFGGIRQLMANA